MSAAKKVLYIEDNDDSLELVRRAMLLGGYLFLGAADGRTGLALAQREHPDLILLDINLPDLDGSEVARSLRADFRSIPILAVSADSGPDSQHKALDAGCNQYLVKPVDVSELWQIVAAYLPD